MSEIETLLRRSFASHHDTVTVDDDLLDGAIARGVRRSRRRQTLLGGSAVMVVIVVIASLTIVSGRSTDDSGLSPSGASAPWWSVVEVADPSIFSGDGVTFFTQMTPWQDQLVVLGEIQPGSGASDVYAWTTHDGVNWERRLQDLPAGCGFSNGVVALDNRLVVTCSIHDTSPDGEGSRVGVATTSDLESWTMTPISDNGQWFGSLIGEGPNGAVVVQGLEADDPNTTLGSTMRIWSSSDLVTWTPIDGETPTTLLDGQASAIRSFDDRIVVTGMFNDRADQADPEAPASMLPAIWVSTDGAAFVRTLLRSADVSTGPTAAVMDLVSTGSGYVAVGAAGDPSAALAWTSPDLVDWSTVAITSGMPASDAEDAASSLLWDVEMLPDGTLLAAGTGPRSNGAVAEGWLSDDGGAGWRTVGVGPGFMALWNGGAVGMSGGPRNEPTFWTWGGDTRPRSSSVDLGAAEDLGVGEARWYAEYQLYLVRDDTAVMAFAQQSPEQGCRLAFADDSNTFDAQLRDGAVFSDPCHGATFGLDGTHLFGPSPRDLDQYRVEISAGRIIVDTTRLLTAP
jgi:hypothetical protein